MMIIDFHNHVYPPDYVKEVEKGPSAYSVTYDDDGNPVLHSPGDYNILVPGHRLMDVRQQVIKDAGVDKQIISFTAPGTLIETPDRFADAALEPLTNFSHQVAGLWPASAVRRREMLTRVARQKWHDI